MARQLSTVVSSFKFNCRVLAHILKYIFCLDPLNNCAACVYKSFSLMCEEAVSEQQPENVI